MLFEMHQYDIKNVTITWQFLLCIATSACIPNIYLLKRAGTCTNNKDYKHSYLKKVYAAVEMLITTHTSCTLSTSHNYYNTVWHHSINVNRSSTLQIFLK